MDDWKKFNEKCLPEKEDFYSHLNMKEYTDADYAHAKQVCKDFEIKKLGEYHDLHVQNDILLLADVFENFKNVSWNIWPWSCKKIFSSRITMVSSFKKTKGTLDRLTDVDMLLMVEKVLEEGYVTLFINKQKVKTNT